MAWLVAWLVSLLALVLSSSLFVVVVVVPTAAVAAAAVRFFFGLGMFPSLYQCCLIYVIAMYFTL